MYQDVELRKLPAGKLCNIAEILETNNDWKKVMALVPRNPRRQDYFEPKYTNEHIKQIEKYAKISNRKCADILFDEWGTSGRIRPTLSTLKAVVEKAGILRAADALADMLEEERPARPDDGPGAPIDTNITKLMMQESSEFFPNGSTKQMSDGQKQNPSSIGNKTTAVVQSNHHFYSGSKNIPNFSAIMPSETSVAPKNSGPAFQTSFPNLEISIPGIDSDILKNAMLIDFAYIDLEYITRKFSETLIYTPDATGGKLAGKIGSGGFGEVYVGYHPHHGHLAVKKARSHAKFDQKPDIALRVFNAEVRFLSQLRHKNIVPIIGFSRDGPALCIVCEYIDGGSLEQKLAAKNLMLEKLRLYIMIGTAEGLKYLHGYEKPVEIENEEKVTETESQNSKKTNFIHGDVKTANILLTRDCIPKLCDFGLAKQFDNTYFITSCPMGTSAYMAPEGFTGTITQKIDIYSFGIVLLEILTGLKPLVTRSGETINIKDYVEDILENNELNKVLDPIIDKWTKGKELYNLAKSCLVRDRKKRPTSQDICDVLYKLREEVESELMSTDIKSPQYVMFDQSGSMNS